MKGNTLDLNLKRYTVIILERREKIPRKLHDPGTISDLGFGITIDSV